MLQNLSLLKTNKIRLCDIITGDESWFYHKKINKKISNRRWVDEGDILRTLVLQVRFEPKNMFTILLKLMDQF